LAFLKSAISGWLFAQTSEDGATNEMMEIEEQVIEEMREEFRKRLESRLQKRLEAKQQDMPEARDLKKKRRTVGLQPKSTFGDVALHAIKGYCPRRKQWFVPIRESWGLAKNQRLTPALQRKLCCTAVETTGDIGLALAYNAAWNYAGMTMGGDWCCERRNGLCRGRHGDPPVGSKAETGQNGGRTVVSGKGET